METNTMFNFFASNTYFFILIGASLVLGFGTQAYIKSTFAKWSKVPLTSGKTGAQAAREMLDREGLSSVGIEQTSGKLSDHYDPRDATLYLSKDVYHGVSVASAAVACHEAGHAVQDAKNYAFGKIRTALVPAAQFGSRAWLILFFIGMMLQVSAGAVSSASASAGSVLIWTGLILFALIVLFQIVTLPVEFDASRRAVANISTYAGAPGTQEYTGAKSVLTAAALTYVAAALISVMQLLRFIGLARRS